MSSSIEQRVNADIGAVSRHLVTKQLLLLPHECIEDLRVDRSISLQQTLSTLPVTTAIARLSLSHKISVLVNAKGLLAAYRALGLLLDDAPQEVEKELKEFEKAISEITGGVVTIYQSHALAILRMFLFASLDRCLQKSSTIDSKSLMSKVEHIFNSVEFLAYIESLSHVKGGSTIDEDEQISFRRIRLNLQEVKEIIGLCQTRIQAKTFGGSDWIRVERILDLLDLALRDPLLFMPLLLCTPHKDPLDCEMGADLKNIDPRVRGWLPEFRQSVTVQSACFFSGLCRGQNRENVKNKFTSLIQDLSAIESELQHSFDELQSFEALPVSEQARSLGLLMQQLAILEMHHERLLALDIRYLAFKREIKPLIDSPEQVQSYDRSLQQAYYSYRNLLTAVNSSLQNSYNGPRNFFTELNSCFDPSLRAIRNIPLVNLLDCQLREKAHAVLDKTENAKIKKLEGTFQAIFMRIRREAVHRLNNRQRGPDDFYQDLCCANEAHNALHFLTQLCDEDISDASFKELIIFIASLRKSCSIFKLETWPRLFASSPFVSDRADFSDERLFYDRYLSALRQSYLRIGPKELVAPCQALLGQVSNKDAVASISPVLGEVVQRLTRSQQRVRESSSANFETRAREFFNEVTSLSSLIEDEIEELPLETDSACLASLHDILENLDQVVLSPSQPIMMFLFRQELIEEDARKRKAPKIKESRPTAAAAAAAVCTAPVSAPAKSVAKLPKTLPEPSFDFATLKGHFQAFEHECLLMASYCRSFQPTSSDEETVRGVAVQNECATNLMQSLPAIRELIDSVDTFGAHRFYIAALYLKMAVALEQSGKLAMSVLKLGRGPGKENLWQEHDPSLIATELMRAVYERTQSFLLNADQRQLLNRMRRVIAVSSRYPASGRDRLAHVLCEGGESSQDLLRTAFETSLTLLKMIPKRNISLDDRPLSREAFEGCLLPIAPLVLEDNEGDLEARLSRLQQHLAPHINRQVPYIDQEDTSPPKRQAIIRAALQDLKANLNICHSLLAAPEEPSLCLTFGEGGLLRQAVLLEKALQLLLAHLPCRASPHSSEHYLLAGNSPKLFRHDIRAFTERLFAFLEAAPSDLKEQTRQLADHLAPVVQVLYRYHREEPGTANRQLANWKTLTILRDRLIKGLLTDQEERVLDARLGVSAPSERLSKLDAHISQIIRTEMKQPLLATMGLVDQLLEIYERMVFNV